MKNSVNLAFKLFATSFEFAFRKIELENIENIIECVAVEHILYNDTEVILFVVMNKNYKLGDKIKEKIKYIIFIGKVNKPSLLRLRPNIITIYYILLILLYYFKGDNVLLSKIYNIFIRIRRI